MPHWLHVLYAEQTSPDEVVVFLLLGGLAVLVLAFAIYIATLIVFWLLRLRGQERLRAVLFPTPERVRLYAAEYAFAITTAFLLTLSVATRHNVVQAILNQPVEDLKLSEIARAFPIAPPTKNELVAHHVPERDAEVASLALSTEMKGSETPTPLSYGAQSLSVENVLRPLLKAGLPENADVLVKAAVIAVGGRVQPAFPTRNQLLWIAILLLAGYVLWFGWRRSKALAAHGDAETEYGQVARRLAVPALCIPLLLVSAIAVADADRVARSVTAAAGVGETQTPLEEALHDVAVAQADSVRGSNLREGVAAELLRIQAELDAHHKAFDQVANEQSSIRLLISSIQGDVGSLAARAASDSVADANTAAELASGLAAMKNEFATLASRFEAMHNELDAIAKLANDASVRSGMLYDTIPALRAALRNLENSIVRRGVGYLLVVAPTGDYQIHSNSPDGVVRASGTRWGLHALPPGNYVVTGLRATSRSVSISPGGAWTVELGVVVQ